MADLPWFRFYAEAINDVKFKRVARQMQSDPLAIIGAWTVILCLASKSPVRGKLYLTEDEPYTIDDLADAIGWQSCDTDYLVTEFVKMGMVDVANGAFTITNWGKRQYESDSSTERVRKHRNETLQERYSNVSVTPPDTDTDTDTESINDDDEPKKSQNPNIFTLYEQNIGILTPIISEKLKAAETDYPVDWFPWAFGQAVSNNARSWAYIDACLKNRRDGKDHIPRARSPAGRGKNSASSKQTDQESDDAIIQKMAKEWTENGRI